MFHRSTPTYEIRETGLSPLPKEMLSRQVWIAVLYRDEASVDTTFLEKILSAVGLRLHKDVLFLPLFQEDFIPMGRLLKSKQPNTVMVFGATPFQLGLQVAASRYEPSKLGGATFLWADALSVLEADRHLKSQLWNAMKVLFSI